ncbi:MAG: DEAD/DEAH box helicase [Oligosphaeraceae bacterium]|nr:DEAD/DEAH box helicase [Oligosphaeraceae bacterium]
MTLSPHSEDQDITRIDVETAEQTPAPTGFDGFGLIPALLQGIADAGFAEPTPIQVQAIPPLLAGHDLIGQALTGSGKTAAFALPAMQRIANLSGLQLLILVPTRELAAQVSSEVFKLGQHANIRTAAFTGGQSYTRQEKLLKQGINVLVATPGRLIDLMQSGHFDQVNPAIIVVDEADEMLDMGFLEDVKVIFEKFPGPRQTMLFSATMPKQVVALAQQITNDPVEITSSFADSTNNEIEQSFFVIDEHERVNATIRLIDSDNVNKALIFCRTKEETDALNIMLGARGYNVNCLHGDMEQAQRSRVMAAFRRGEIDILVATDVAARGLDIEDVSHVFNFHLPFDSRGYVHRIGRTGRAGKSGKAITLVTPRELRQLEAIKRKVGAELQLGKIPSREEVNAQRLQKIYADLFASELDNKLYQQVLEFSKEQDQDSLVLFTKLLSKFLRHGNDEGPENIGLSGERLESVLNPQRVRKTDTTEQRRRRGRARRERSWQRRSKNAVETRPERRDDNAGTRPKYKIAHNVGIKSERRASYQEKTAPARSYNEAGKGRRSLKTIDDRFARADRKPAAAEHFQKKSKRQEGRPAHFSTEQPSERKGKFSDWKSKKAGRPKRFFS